MLILVTYDVSTESKAGRRRLRRIAKVCLDYGQRVQLSVFECQVDQIRYEEMHRRLLEEMDEGEDCLRLYRLPKNYQQHVMEYGKFTATNFSEPLIL